MRNLLERGSPEDPVEEQKGDKECETDEQRLSLD